MKPCILILTIKLYNGYRQPFTHSLARQSTILTGMFLA